MALAELLKPLLPISDRRYTNEKQILEINQKDHSQAKGMNMNDLINSRKKILQIADWIIPGHGKMFKNPEKKYKK